MLSVSEVVQTNFVLNKWELKFFKTIDWVTSFKQNIMKKTFKISDII